MRTKPTRFYSKRQENKVAKQLDGKRTANSGATPFQKGDVMLDDWLIECKTKFNVAKSFSIKREWLDKNKEEAFAMNKSHNALCFDYGNSDRYYVIDEKTFKEFLELLKSET